MTQPVTVQDMITQLAEGQRHLQLVFELQNENARKEREAFQTALKEQATLLTSNQKVQDTAILCLTDVISNARVHPNIPGSVLQKFQEGEDPDFFFTNFERVATTATWPAERWGQYIAPLLSGELQAAYQAANPAGVTPYPEIKKAILERLGCEQEYYRARFRKEKWVTGDNPRALFYRVRDLGSRWLQPSTATMEEVTEQVFLEQYLEALPVNTRAWLKQHPGLTSQSAIELACAYHRSPDFKASTGRTPIILPKPVPRVSNDSVEKRSFPTIRTPPKPFPKPNSPVQVGPQCFRCAEWGHISRNCPLNNDGSEPMEVGWSRGRVLVTGQGRKTYKKNIRLNGKPLEALLDTGCHHMVVVQDLIPLNSLCEGETVLVSCVHGDVKEYPLAEVLLEIDGYPQVWRVGVVPRLPETILLGTDLPKFHDYLMEASEQEARAEWLQEAPFVNENLVQPRDREQKSKNEKRRDKERYNSACQSLASCLLSSPEHGDTPARSFCTAQKDDSTLTNAWNQVQESDSEKEPSGASAVNRATKKSGTEVFNGNLLEPPPSIKQRRNQELKYSMGGKCLCH
ncbi:uncharacterized protein LOC144828150 isoform X1 [Lissotriton helveticus]